MPNSRRASSARRQGPAVPAPAGAAGLRYVTDRTPGIRRVRRGAGFRFLHPDGRPVTDDATLARIRALAIPPAYRDVWICPRADGHIQATGRDARGRKQYRYHARWRAVRDATKFERMLAFSRALPAIRRQVARDLARPALSRTKVIAAVVRLLHDTCIRVGNEEYARSNGSYGLTTLRDRHVTIRRDEIVFEFRGKRGKEHLCRLRDRRLARILAHCRAIPGERLFQYVDERGRRQAIDSGDLNAYLRTVVGEEFSAKDFRTWSGSLLALGELLAAGPGEGARERRQTVLAVVDRVAERLHNTRAVCRKFYVHPAILAAYEEGRLAAMLGARAFGPEAAADPNRTTTRALVRFLRAVAGAHRTVASHSLQKPRTRRARPEMMRGARRSARRAR